MSRNQRQLCHDFNCILRAPVICHAFDHTRPPAHLMEHSLSPPWSCQLSGRRKRRSKRSDSPDKAAERIRASTKPEEQKRRAAAAAKAALPAGRPNGATSNGHHSANGSGATDSGSQQRRQREHDLGSQQQPPRGGDDPSTRDGSTGGQQRAGRGRSRSKGEADAVPHSGNPQPARSRGDAAAVVSSPGSRVPDVVVDRPQRPADRYSSFMCHVVVHAQLRTARSKTDGCAERPGRWMQLSVLGCLEKSTALT